MPDQCSQLVRVNELKNVPTVDDAFLSQVVADIDCDEIMAIALTGSCARKEETVFSDVDIMRVAADSAQKHLFKRRYTYHESRLVSISTHGADSIRANFSTPNKAIFVVPSIREARILVDKEGAFQSLQQEAWEWTWEPLQGAANKYVGTLLVNYTEYIHKILRALLLKDEFALTEMILGVISAVTDAISIQKGVLASSGNSFFQQTQEAVGFDSIWSCYHRLLVGIDSQTELSLCEKGVVALRLFEETIHLLRYAFDNQHREILDQTLKVVNSVI